MSEFEFMRNDFTQDWPVQSQFHRLLRNGIQPDQYVFKLERVAETSPLDYEDEVGTSHIFTTGVWRDVYAPTGQSFDGLGGWRIFIEISNSSSVLSGGALFDVFVANDDGFGGPVAGTEALIRWQVSYDQMSNGGTPGFRRVVEPQVPAQVTPETDLLWAGPPVVSWARDATDFVIASLNLYTPTGGGGNYEIDWYRWAHQEAQRGYGHDNFSDTAKYLKYGTSDWIQSNSMPGGGFTSIIARVDYVSGDTTAEVNFGNDPLATWLPANDLFVWLLKDFNGVEGVLSGVYDITLARNLYPQVPFPYQFDPLPGSEQRRRVKFVTEYTVDADAPLPDLSPPYDPDYPAPDFIPFQLTFRVTAGALSVTLPLIEDDIDLFGSLGHGFTVTWGDGATDVIVDYLQAERTHTYATAGDYEVSIKGMCQGWSYGYSGLPASEALKLLEVRAWGTTDIRSFYRGFEGCANLVISATDAPDLSICANTQAMFLNCTSITTGFTQWRPSKVVTMVDMFRGATLFNDDLSIWPVGAVKDMANMFRDSGFNGDVSAWDVFGCTNFAGMFTGSPFSTANYDLLLVAWSAIRYLTFNRALDVDVPYTIATAQAGHDYLTGTVFWTLNDSGGV